MKYIVDIPKWLDSRIKRILANEETGYKSVEDFVVVACENQAMIEEGGGEEPETLETLTMQREFIRTDRPQNLLNPSFPDISTVGMPSPDKLETALLWGQVYRIFPIKLGTRILANVVLGKGTEYVDAEEFRDKATSTARAFGMKLKALDMKTKRKPGEKLSTGLPVGNKVELSKDHYKAHYLAYQTGKGTLTGALANLRLANIDDEKIGITVRGVQFARLKNPLLDIGESQSEATLSEEEIRSYLSIVNEFLPIETKFMRIVLSMIDPREPPRNEFNSKVKKFLEEVWNKEITDAVANTMRSGVLSRMWELGLVQSKQLGRSVVYSITNAGRDYLENAMEN